MIISIYFYIISTSILYISVVAVIKADLSACLPQMIPGYVNEFQYLAVDGTKQPRAELLAAGAARLRLLACC